MTVCKHCGTEIENGLEYCPNCGQELDETLGDFFEPVEELEEPEEEDELLPLAMAEEEKSVSKVFLPARPSAVRPFFFWNALTASMEPVPYTPSMEPV